MHLGRQEQLRLKALREKDQLAAEAEQARLDRENFLAEEEKERQKEMRKRQARVYSSSSAEAYERGPLHFAFLGLSCVALCVWLAVTPQATQ